MSRVGEYSAARKPSVEAVSGRRTAFLAHPAVIFFILSMLLGSVVVILTPPLRGPDEGRHFLRVYGISVGQIVPSIVDERGRRGIFLPARLHDDYMFFEEI